VRLFDQERPTHRSKPIGAMGATVLYHVGDTAPCDPAEWTFARNASKPAFEVDVPLSVEAGSKVWLTAFWFNKRMQPGQAAKAKSTRISEGLARAA